MAALASAPAFAAKPATTTAEVQPKPQGRLVFAVHTGPEDLATLSSVMRQIKAAKESGFLSEVAIIFYGRSVPLFDPNSKVMPDDLRARLAEARQLGVRVMVCGHALERYGVTVEEASAYGEVVPAAIVELSKMVAEGWEVLSY